LIYLLLFYLNIFHKSYNYFFYLLLILFHLFPNQKYIVDILLQEVDKMLLLFHLLVAIFEFLLLRFGNMFHSQLDILYFHYHLKIFLEFLFLNFFHLLNSLFRVLYFSIFLAVYDLILYSCPIKIQNFLREKCTSLFLILNNVLLLLYNLLGLFPIMLVEFLQLFRFSLQ